MNELLDPAYLRELEGLRRGLSFRARSGRAGEHTAAARGSSAEFREHRPYAPGDDLRRVDWLAFARTGQPVTKTFRAEEDVLVRVLLDDSASMGIGSPSKAAAARRIAAGLAYLVLAEGERAQAFFARDGRLHGSEIGRGRGGLARFARGLVGAKVGGTASLAAAIANALPTWARPGGLVVVGDFLEADDRLQEAIERAAYAGHDVRLVQVLADEEQSPPWSGDVELEDAETGELVSLTVTPAVRAAYDARLRELERRLATLARRTRGSFARAGVAEAPAAVLRRVLARSVDG